MSNDPHPGMMGDGTEEQSLGQPGNPNARITQDEVEAAFEGQRADEPRAFGGEEAWVTLKERAATVREHVADTAEAVREWAADQAAAAKQTASDKPVLVVSISAGTALALGLAVGFILGRSSQDYL